MRIVASAFISIFVLSFLSSCDQNKKSESWQDYYAGTNNGKPEYRIRYYDGDSVLKHIIRFNKQGLQDGFHANFFENGVRKSLSTYGNGLLDGQTILFFNSGAIESITPFSKGLKDGFAYGFYDNGAIRYKMTWSFDTVVNAVEYDLDGRVTYSSINN